MRQTHNKNNDNSTNNKEQVELPLNPPLPTIDAHDLSLAQAQIPFNILGPEIPFALDDIAHEIDQTPDDSMLALTFESNSSTLELATTQIDALEQIQKKIEDGHISDLFYNDFGIYSGVDSVPRDLGLFPFPKPEQKVLFTIFRETPEVETNIELPPPPPPPVPPPVAHNDGFGPAPDNFKVYESGLPNGTDNDPNNPNPPAQPSPIQVTGNILTNDDLGTPAADISKVHFNGIDYFPVNGVITVQTIDGILLLYTEASGGHAEGDFIFTLNTATDHASGQGNNILSQTLQYTIFNPGGESSANILIHVVDDVPILITHALDVSPDQLIVDETLLNVNATANFADNFNLISIYGADGPGNLSTQYSLSILNPGVNSGLIDTLTQQNVLLSVNISGQVEGRTETSNDLVFTLTVDNTGLVTLDQIRALVHSNPTDPNDTKSLSTNDLIQLTRTDSIIDHDADSVSSSASINIGLALIFHDDAPSINTNEITIPTLTVDETNFAMNASSSFASLFTSNFGNDGPKDTDNNDIADADAITYQLGVSAAGVNSLLIDTLTNSTVNLFLESGAIVGRSATGNLEVFRITVDANGVVTLDQSRSVVHSVVSDPNDAKGISADLITLTATITDGDGDQAQALKNIGGAFSLLDDGPSININQTAVPTLTVDETNFAINASSSFASLFTGNFGNDGPKDTDNNDIADADAITYQLGVSAAGVNSLLIDTLTNSAVNLFLESGAIVGRSATGNLEVFRITVDANGVVTLDQSRAVVHNIASDPDTSEASAGLAANLITLTATITDGDGDQAQALKNIGGAFSFLDDGPYFTNINDPDNNLTVEISSFNPASSTNNIVQLADWVFGADGSGGNPLLQSVTGNVQLVSSSPTQVVLNFLDAASNVVATMTLNANGTDNLQIFHRPNVIATDVLLTSDVTAGGPELTKYIISTISDLRIMVTGSDGNGTPGQATDAVNPSNQGWAVDNNIINRFESITFAFIDQSDFPVITPKPIQNFSFTANGFTGGESQFDIQITVTYQGGTTEVFLLTGANGVTDGQVISVKDLVGFNTGTLIQSVEIKHIDTTSGTNDGFRLNNVTISSETQTPPPDLNFNFTLKVTDGDSDFSTQAFSLALSGIAGSGITVDGPIAGATIFEDTDFNSILASQGEVSTLSNALGAYNLIPVDTNLDGVIDMHDGRLVSIGGTDTHTQLSYDIPLLAPLGSSVISPLTSLLQAQLEITSHAPQTVMTSLTEVLGLAPDTDITHLNTSLSTNGNNTPLLQAAAVMTLSIQLSDLYSAITGSSPMQIADNIYKAIGNELLKLPEGTIANFSNTELLNNIMNDVNHQLNLTVTLPPAIMDLLSLSQVLLQSSLSHLPPGANLVDAISAAQHLTQGSISEFIHNYFTMESVNHTTPLSEKDVAIYNATESSLTSLLNQLRHSAASTEATASTAPTAETTSTSEVITQIQTVVTSIEHHLEQAHAKQDA